MSTVKTPSTQTNGNSNTIRKGVNPFIKLMRDQERIADAIKNHQPLSSLKDIKFVQPI